MDTFNVIAPIYGLFYNRQKKRFESILDDMKAIVNSALYKSVLDVGCGTGALCDVLDHRGFHATCIDSAQKMLDIALKKQGGRNITYIKANVLEGLPFEDNSFDFSIASYVAHGLKLSERKKMYAEMSRVSKQLVIIYDYNENRSVLTNIIEYLEGGNYFDFIKNSKAEISDALKDLKIINVDKRAAWYIGKPK